MLLKAQGHGKSIKPSWGNSMKRLAQAFVNTWNKHKTFGNFVNVSTRDVAIYNSTSGAMAIGGLALASRYFNNPSYLTVATEAGQFYYNNDILKTGQITGCCSDILQNADLETTFGLMTSFMALYETSGQAQWRLIRQKYWVIWQQPGQSLTTMSFRKQVASDNLMRMLQELFGPVLSIRPINYIFVNW
jgi:hypothetical protein